MRKWYQNVEGVDAVFEDPKRKESKFWGEGKWNNFIKPLLASVYHKDRGTFIEIGCNAGLFLKMSADVGFRGVIGVDSSIQGLKQARIFRDANKGAYTLMHRQVGVDFDLRELPVADVVLLSNMHYYLPIPVFSHLVDELRNRVRYCIVVGARAKSKRGNALHFLDAPGVRGYFRDWKELTVIKRLKEKNDPAPREQMYSVLFEGNLEVCDVRTWYEKWCSDAATGFEYYGGMRRRHRSFELAPVLGTFFREVLKNDPDFDPEKTALYEYWKRRYPKESPDWVLGEVTRKVSLALDIQKNGIKEPIYFNQVGKILDGLHRMCIAYELGYEHVLVRKL